MNNRRGLVYILVCGVYNLGYGGIIVHNLSTRCTLARKINSKAAWVYRTNLVKWVSYKAKDPIKFKGGKEVAGFDVI